jgi:hypothetical protein
MSFPAGSIMATEAGTKAKGAEHLIEQIEAMQPGDELHDAKVSVLSEQAHRHVEAEATGLDLEALGTEMADLKESLMAGMRPPPKLCQAG